MNKKISKKIINKALSIITAVVLFCGVSLSGAGLGSVSLIYAGEWAIKTQACTNTSTNLLAVGNRVEISKLRLDSSSTAETITIYDSATVVLTIYQADDATFETDFDPPLVFYTSVKIKSSQNTTPSNVTLVYRTVR